MNRTAAALARLSDGKLLEAVQRQTFVFFWDGAEKASFLIWWRLAAPASALWP